MRISDFFKENKSEINQLLKLKLKVSQELEWQLTENIKYSSTSYYSSIQLWRGKIIERVFALRLYRGKTQYQEVIRRIEGNKFIGVKNMYCTRFGYVTVWSNTKPTYYYWSETDRDIWYTSDIKYYNVYSTPLFDLQDLINADPSLKYCAWTKQPIIYYITIYRKYPEIEMISKLKLDRLMYNTTILEKMKDKAFKKFLFKFGGNSGVNGRETLYCYKHKMTYAQYLAAQRIIKAEKRADEVVKNVLEEYPQIPKDKLRKYVIDKDIYTSNYLDLLKAETYLHLDLTLEKNIFPHDFMYWHDYYTKQMQDSLNKDIDIKIEEAASRYKKLAKGIDGIKLLLPTSTNDLIVEGEKLSHCVGRMGYNKKIARDESLILFVRKDSEIDTPYVTMEYDPHKKQVLQLYAEHDTQPEETIKDIIYKKWLPKVKRLNFA